MAAPDCKKCNQTLTSSKAVFSPEYDGFIHDRCPIAKVSSGDTSSARAAMQAALKRGQQSRKEKRLNQKKRKPRNGNENNSRRGRSSKSNRKGNSSQPSTINDPRPDYKKFSSTTPSHRYRNQSFKNRYENYEFNNFGARTKQNRPTYKKNGPDKPDN